MFSVIFPVVFQVLFLAAPSVSLAANKSEGAKETVTLDRAFQSAVLQSETLAEQDQMTLQAEEHVVQARGAILPSVHGEFTYLRQDASDDAFAREFSPTTQRALRISATQPLFRGLRELAALKGAKQLVQAQREARSQAVILLVGEVAQAFYTVLALEADRKNLNAELEIYDDRITDLRRRARIGESSSTDVVSVEAARTEVESQIKETAAQLETERESFAFLTGLDRGARLESTAASLATGATGLRSAKVAGPLDFYLARLEERPDIREAKARLEAANQDLLVAKRAYWPSADLLGNYHFVRPGGFLTGVDWDVQLTVTIPIYEGGILQSEVREATARRTQAELALARAKRQAETEIRTYHINFLANGERIGVLERSIELHRRNYQMVKRDYGRGLFNNIDVLVSLTSYRQARRALDRARYTTLVDLVRLRASVGILPGQDATTSPTAR